MVKTRLAKDIGDDAAYKVYLELLRITQSQVDLLTDTDAHVYLSDHKDDSLWEGYPQFIQEQGDLGQRMSSAFAKGFELGYENIIGIGTDLPEMSADLIKQAFDELKRFDAVFGPATDGGYYLLGMKQMISSIFKNKNWSTEHLYQETKDELIESGVSISELKTLNDIDTLDDLKKSTLSYQ